jgi:alpha 1,3-glucosidase
LFGFYYHSASADGLARRGREVRGADGDRPFVLSRSFFAGTQRVGPIWTGDNMAQWSHLKVGKWLRRAVQTPL